MFKYFNIYDNYHQNIINICMVFVFIGFSVFSFLFLKKKLQKKNLFDINFASGDPYYENGNKIEILFKH